MKVEETRLVVLHYLSRFELYFIICQQFGVVHQASFEEI